MSAGEAWLRKCRYYAELVDKLAIASQSQPNCKESLDQFELERPNIASAWEWASHRVSTDKSAARVCVAFLSANHLFQLLRRTSDLEMWGLVGRQAARTLDDHAGETSALRCMSSSRYLEERFDQAEEFDWAILKILEENFPEDQPSIASAIMNIVNASCAQGKYEEVGSLMSRALTIRKETCTRSSPLYAWTLIFKSDIDRGLKRYVDAECCLGEAVGILEHSLGEAHPDIAACLHRLAWVYREQGRFDESREAFLRALSIWEIAFGSNHGSVGQCLHDLASLHYRQNQLQEAKTLLEQAIENLRQADTPVDAILREAYGTLGLVYHDLSDFQSAEQAYRAALETTQGWASDQEAPLLRFLAEYCREQPGSRTH